MRNQAGGGLVKGEGPGLRFMYTEQEQTEEVMSHTSLEKLSSQRCREKGRNDNFPHKQDEDSSNSENSEECEQGSS